MLAVSQRQKRVNMKLLGIVFAMVLCAQNIELVPLSANETNRLSSLDAAAAHLEEISSKALNDALNAREKFCKELQGIKQVHGVKESSGACGNTAWANGVSSTGSGTTITTAMISSSGYGAWEVDKTMKFLVHRR